MKNFILLILCISAAISNGQISTNAIEVSPWGELKLRRYAGSDFVFKNAMMPSYTSVSPAELWINFGEEFGGGVKFHGTTIFHEISMATFPSVSSYIGFGKDFFSHSSTSITHYGLTRRPGNIVGLSGYLGLEFFTNSALRIKILDNGNVGIGTSSPDEKLTVNGKIHAKEVKIDLYNFFPDYVFQKYFTGTSELMPNYEMIPLSELEEFIRDKHHLPDVPTASQIKEKGLELGEMNRLLLQKIEELTLYILEQNKRLEILESNLN